MQHLGFIIYHSAAKCRDWASLYIILSPYAETGLHYISFRCSMQRLASLYIILLLYTETEIHYISFSRYMQRLDFIIYYSASLCRDYDSLFIILSLNAETVHHYISFCPSMPKLGSIIYHSVVYAETGLHYISFCRSTLRLGFIIYHSSALCRDWASLSFCPLCRALASLYIILSLYARTGLHYISLCGSM